MKSRLWIVVTTLSQRYSGTSKKTPSQNHNGHTSLVFSPLYLLFSTDLQLWQLSQLSSPPRLHIGEALCTPTPRPDRLDPAQPVRTIIGVVGRARIKIGEGL